MIHPKDFHLLKVNDFEMDRNDNDLTNFVGFDSEAYINGEAFMFCTSKRDVILPENLLDTLFSDKYIQNNLLLYNLKYDTGAMFRHLLPITPLKELQMYNDAKYEGFHYKYIPHKYLKISRIGKMKEEYVRFWDIAQFFRPMGLKKAAKTYLGPEFQKIEEDTEEYTHENVAARWNDIAKYCIQDSVITLELGKYFFGKLKEWDIPIKSIYSTASISSEYVNRKLDVFTTHKWFFKKHRLVCLAYEAYRGGKFEMTARGSADVYMYDISSAYPYEIRNLIDIRKSKTFSSSKYQKSAVYGFLRVRIDNTQEKHLPCGVYIGKSLIYPSGVFYTTITKQEYDYMVFELGIPVDIIQGEWIELSYKPRYPFRHVFDNLYKMKDSYKDADKMMYKTAKILQNGFYGKFIQKVEDKRTGVVTVGRDWNQIYGAIITANTRIRMCRIQNLLKEKCLGVHTDSVITTVALPDSLLKRRIRDSNLGRWEAELEGKRTSAILIATGQYQIGDGKCAFRGLIPAIIDDNGNPYRDTWRKILERNPNKSEINYIEKRRPESWCATMSRNRPVNEINLFQSTPKTLDLNCDIKRDWPTKFRANDFLTKLEYGNPIIGKPNKPGYWNKKIPYYLPKKKT